MGIPSRNEPTTTQKLRRNVEVFSIFEAAGWTEFLQHLNGFHWETTLKFVLNIIESHLEVKGLHIEVTEEIVAEVIGLPQIGRD